MVTTRGGVAGETLIPAASWPPGSAPSGAGLGAQLGEFVLVARDPLRRGLEAAEGVEVQLDHAVLARVESLLQVTEEILRPGLAEQVGNRQAVLLRDRRGGGDAEPGGEAEQQLDAG